MFKRLFPLLAPGKPPKVLDRLAVQAVDGEDGTVPMVPGVTISIPAERVHGFRVLGDEPLVTYGIHTFGARIVPRSPEW